MGLWNTAQRKAAVTVVLVDFCPWHPLLLAKVILQSTIFNYLKFNSLNKLFLVNIVRRGRSTRRCRLVDGAWPFPPGLPTYGRKTWGYARFDPPRRIFTRYNFGGNRLSQTFTKNNWSAFWIRSASADPTMNIRGWNPWKKSRKLFTIRLGGSNWLTRVVNFLKMLRPWYGQSGFAKKSINV